MEVEKFITPSNYKPHEYMGGFLIPFIAFCLLKYFQVI